MKKLLLLFIFLWSALSYGQTVNGIPLKDLDANYLRVNAEKKLLKPFQVRIYIDYGQIARLKDIKKGFVYDDNGKQYSFNGIMGVVNLLNEYGYQVEMVYSDDAGVNYIMRKE
ncbi:hypothetical protein N9483_07145 [Flavobacteriaceae bacterium]|nr:hypothetical protein [Flavobacteriaceae bacterium]